MKHILLIFLFCMAANILQAQQITNVLATQDGDNVQITFDITEAKKGQNFDIEVKCSTDGGSTFSIFPASLSGDIKGITAGTNKQIIWNVLQDRDEIVGEDIVFELTATVKGGDFSETSGTFTDARDGQEYPFKKIGTQVWTTKNMNFETTKSYCYDNNPKNCKTYGRLYEFETAQKACPDGWHVPSDAEWTILIDYLGGSSTAGGKLKEVGTIHWQSPNTYSDNSSGFSALPGGYRDYNYGSFGREGSDGNWWSSTASSASYAIYRYLYSNYATAYKGSFKKQHGFSVRCVRD